MPDAEIPSSLKATENIQVDVDEVHSFDVSPANRANRGIRHREIG